mmetsp:Transcript_38332/g.151544  ORF Transcript_38332/g.151544 Transcript_38332/m.151544 type:complete len:89 (+) Transcript_38332:122-388(+)|eukprot:CAMPEP_0113969706 /NCGR_PEP_ID=MMETSP0011_2-20120614/10531_1 /TAXON_ID=101924 /ORGANISM="Rhodosorus marinus" /LENGTH=88 /DNA_ID=CAMNT_0000983523 /DNA_START=70 /DNA_END=336 /DNA_ORIENTATION=- /assembly_acc=CAM_ASM_000156
MGNGKFVGKENPVGKENVSLYDILQVDKNASEEEIKKAFRSLARKLHPDRNPDKDAAEQFQQLQKDYEAVLIDRRRRYSLWLGNGGYG